MKGPWPFVILALAAGCGQGRDMQIQGHPTPPSKAEMRRLVEEVPRFVAKGDGGTPPPVAFEGDPVEELGKWAESQNGIFAVYVLQDPIKEHRAAVLGRYHTEKRPGRDFLYSVTVYYEVQDGIWSLACAYHMRYYGEVAPIAYHSGVGLWFWESEGELLAFLTWDSIKRAPDRWD